MSQFESRLLAEGVRTVEGASPNQTTYPHQSNEKNFECLVLDRAHEYDTKFQISPLFEHFNKLTKNFHRLCALLMFILGALAVKNMLFTDQLTSINFFWAFALFFIPNLCMLFAWLFLFLKPDLLQNSNISKFSLFAIKKVEGRFNKQAVKKPEYWTLFRCYFDIHFSKKIGLFQLSKLTHLLWLSYFSGATLMSIVMLATHQVDFVWQTSILSTGSFQSLTQILAYFPGILGFPVPSIEQIQQSHLGIDNLVDAESRRLAWSSLLISSLLFYGLLPRFILLVVMSRQFKRATAAYRLDFSFPYYVQLRQLLKPNKTTLGITDADEEAEVFIKSAENSAASKQQKTSLLPTDFYPLAIELSTKQLKLAEGHLQKIHSNNAVTLVNVCDHQSQQQVLTSLNRANGVSVAIYVALNRAPDRGLKRFVGELTNIKGKQFHLFLIIDNQPNSQRDNDWYQLANEVGIALDNILHIEAQGLNNE